MGLLALSLYVHTVGLHLRNLCPTRNQGLPYQGHFSSANLSHTTATAAAATRPPSQNKLLMWDLFIYKYVMLLLMTILISHLTSRPSPILICGSSIWNILVRIDPVCACESDSSPRLCLFTTSPSHISWLTTLFFWTQDEVTWTNGWNFKTVQHFQRCFALWITSSAGCRLPDVAVDQYHFHTLLMS